ncbi:MAG: nitroreductase [Firmicutes bacterium]|nr:nitroreductase [Bacillota bacterium]
MTKDVFDAMREVHSVRNFKPIQVSEPTLTRIMEAACWAPSAGNLQPWYFYVVTNDTLKNKIAEVCDDQQQVNEAPVIIVVLADPARSNAEYGERGAQLYCLQDTAAATTNIMLAAEGLGLDTCWVGGFDEVAVQTFIEAPPRLRAVAIICLGYGNERERHIKERLRLAEVVKILH